MATVIDRDTYLDLNVEVSHKASELHRTLCESNVFPEGRARMARLLVIVTEAAFTIETLDVAALVEHREALDEMADLALSPQGRERLLHDKIAQIEDLRQTLSDMMALIPEVREVERARLAVRLTSPAAGDA